MQVTEKGKAIFEEAFARTGKGVCKIGLVEQKDGRVALTLDLVDAKEAGHIQLVDGVPFELSADAEQYLEHAVFDGEGNNLKVIARPHGGCGHHHGGCRHHHDECDCDENCDCCSSKEN